MFQALIVHLDSLIDNNLFVISKLKQNLSVLKREPNDEYRNNNFIFYCDKNQWVQYISNSDREKLESDCCDLFGLIIAVWQDLLKSNVPLTFTDAIIRSLQKFYVALTGFIRYVSLFLFFLSVFFEVVNAF